MLLPRFVARIFSVTTLVLGAGLVSGQDYPNKPVRIITSEPGGGNDFAARLVAPALTVRLGQQVIVENRAGAGGVIAISSVAQAPPDGYTLLLYSGTMWTLPLLRANVPYDPVKDFSPITLMVATPAMLAVHPSLPVRSVKELIALGRTRPGELNYGSAGLGGANNLSVELFKAMTAVNFVHVPYKGTGSAITALIAGEVQLMISNADGVAPHAKSGKVRALAITSTKPSALFPNLPTVSAAGVPGYEFASRTGMFAPAKTSAVIINRLNQEIVRVLNQPEVKEKFFGASSEIIGSSPEQHAATMKSEMDRLGKVIKDTGIRAE